MTLTGQERETIINFNEAEDTAYIFTYNARWIRHIESLGIKCKKENSFGGKFYELPKSMIKLPRGKKKLSEATKAKLSARMKKLHGK